MYKTNLFIYLNLYNNMKNKSFCIADRFIRCNYYYMNLLFFILFSYGVIHTGGKNLLYNSIDRLILGVYFCNHEYECLDQTFNFGAQNGL